MSRNMSCNAPDKLNETMRQIAEEDGLKELAKCFTTIPRTVEPSQPKKENSHE